MSRYPVRRPTELAALAAAARSPRQLPPVESLFAALVVTNALDDRRGSNLIGHAIARHGGAIRDLPQE